MKKLAKKSVVSLESLAKMVVEGFKRGETKIESFESKLDIRITRLESYMKEGFDSLSDKVDHVDERSSYQMENIGRRIDDIAENKVSKLQYRDLEKRIALLESKLVHKK